MINKQKQIETTRHASKTTYDVFNGPRVLCGSYDQQVCLGSYDTLESAKLHHPDAKVV